MRVVDISVEFKSGEDVTAAARQMIVCARLMEAKQVVGEFNGSPIVAYMKDSIGAVVRRWEDGRQKPLPMYGHEDFYQHIEHCTLCKVLAGAEICDLAKELFHQHLHAIRAAFKNGGGE